MTKLTAPIFALALALAFGCGGAAPSGDTTPTPMPKDTDETPVADGLDCSKPPAAIPVEEEGAAEDPFSVTNQDRAETAGTERTFDVNHNILVAQSEGGSTYISVFGLNECGLWIKELGIGSEIAGDADRRDEKVELVKATDGKFIVERIGAKLEVAELEDSDGQMFKVKTLTDIAKYEGE